jgi:hypothetical protein
MFTLTHHELSYDRVAGESARVQRVLNSFCFQVDLTTLMLEYGM